MTALELAAALLGIANVVLVVRRSVWNFPVALAMVSLYGLLFFRERLYSDAILQGFFFAVNLWGWRLWYSAAAREGEVRPRRMTWDARLGWLAGGAAASAAWGTAMAWTTDAAYPWWDAGVAGASVVAQVLLARRFVENWLLWIAVDLGALPLYAVKGLYPTVGLYALMLLFSIAGLFAWERAR